MRVIAGSLKGRRFGAPRGGGTRPTSDRVREALFSILGPLSAVRLLDLYAGTGALAFEALSRGAHRAVLVEREAGVLRVLRRNIAQLGLDARTTVLAASAERAAAAVARLGPYDIVFADPPYANVEAARVIGSLLATTGVLVDRATIVIEHAGRQAPPALECAELLRTRRYGDTALSFYCATAAGNLTALAPD